jgi:hypothetical protein
MRGQIFAKRSNAQKESIIVPLSAVIGKRPLKLFRLEGSSKLRAFFAVFGLRYLAVGRV